MIVVSILSISLLSALATQLVIQSLKVWPDLHEEYPVDEVEHIDDGGHAGRLDVQRRVRRRRVAAARVRLAQPLLQHHGLLRQVAEALRRFAGLLVLLAELQVRT